MLTEAPIGTGTACRGVTAVLGGKAVRCSAGRTTAGALRASDPFAPVRGFLGNVEGGQEGGRLTGVDELPGAAYGLPENRAAEQGSARGLGRRVHRGVGGLCGEQLRLRRGRLAALACGSTEPPVLAGRWDRPDPNAAPF
jgi:hypothetical protein